MAKTVWPVGTDLVTFLGSVSGVTAPSSGVCDDLCLAAVAEFELLTEYQPFLAAGTASDRRFDPPDGRSGYYRLPIKAATVSSVKIGYSATSAGTTLTEYTDYVLSPENAVERGVPFQWIDFLTSPGSEPRSVLISAKWGYQLTIPYDAWLAVLKMAGALAIDQTQNAAGLLTKIKQGELEYSYGGSGSKSTALLWAEEFLQVAGRYQYVRSD